MLNEIEKEVDVATKALNDDPSSDANQKTFVEACDKNIKFMEFLSGTSKVNPLGDIPFYEYFSGVCIICFELD